jgi:hypothetical protein
MNRLIGVALSRGWREGVLGGSRLWMIAGGVALTIRLLQRLADRERVIVYTEQLPVGETMTIAHESP